jgi:hypothetical protein
METAGFDHPWIGLCLLYVGGWVITFIYAARPTKAARRPGLIRNQNAHEE